MPQYLRAAAALKGAGGSSSSSAARAAAAAAAAPPSSPPPSSSRWWWDSPLPPVSRAPPRPAAPPRRSEIEPADEAEEESAAAAAAEAAAAQQRGGGSSGGAFSAMSLLHSADAAADAAAWRGAHLMALGEILFIARPLLYVMALRRFSPKGDESGGASWGPWLLSLSADALSAALLRRGAACCRLAAREASARLAAAGAPAAARAAAASAEALAWSRDERAELARRRALLALYLLRKPAFGAGVAPLLDGGERVLGRVPLLGLLVSRGAEIVRGVTSYYTYTSGS